MTKSEHSFGIIPLRKKGKSWEVLMIRHTQGHWSFPKGHPMENETPQETAEREMEEEVNLKISHYLEMPPFEENYIFTHKKVLIYKKVSYFVAQVKGEVELQQEELSDYRWLDLKEAEEIATFKEAKRILKALGEALSNL